MWGNKNPSKNTSVEANVVDGSLVVALMDAETPKVWRTTEFSKATFEVLTKGDKHILAMTVAGTTEDIAEFSDKSDAVYALRVVMAAMTGGDVVAMPQKTHTHLAAKRENVKRNDDGGRGFFFYLKKFLKFVFWIVLVAAVFVLLVAIFLPAPEGEPGQQTTQTIEKGTPVPAEQLFAD